MLMKYFYLCLCIFGSPILYLCFLFATNDKIRSLKNAPDKNQFLFHFTSYMITYGALICLVLLVRWGLLRSGRTQLDIIELFQPKSIWFDTIIWVLVVVIIALTMAIYESNVIGFFIFPILLFLSTLKLVSWSWMFFIYIFHLIR